MNDALTAVKLALRITTDAFDSELTDLINAALLDMGLAGVTEDSMNAPLVRNAVITYCKLHFGEGPADPVRMKASYDEQKAQLSTATGYTNWGL
jgi:hypothetical protein